MPFYEFLCKKCGVEYEELCPYDETGKYAKVKCPECNSKKKEKLVAACAFQFAQPEGTDRWNSDTGGHGYRFEYNKPKVRKERQMAEALSHMGPTPYNDTTEKDLKLDVGVHDAKTRQGLS